MCYLLLFSFYSKYSFSCYWHTAPRTNVWHATSRPQTGTLVSHSKLAKPSLNLINVRNIYCLQYTERCIKIIQSFLNFKGRIFPSFYVTVTTNITVAESIDFIPSVSNTATGQHYESPKTHLSVILSTLRSSKWAFSKTFSQQNSACIGCLPIWAKCPLYHGPLDLTILRKLDNL
jgi:hypothetical protein